MNNDVVIKKKSGYFQLKSKPSQKELTEYYNKKYYQNGLGSYEKDYSIEEIEYFKNKQKIYKYCLENVLSVILKGKKILDLGCGEGWTLSYFKNNGCKVTGVDYSSFGISRFNPSEVKNFQEVDIYHFIDESICNHSKFDVIFLNNIIEHVLEPEEIILKLKKMINPEGILVITFPNDFSELHDILMKKKKIDKPFWIATPDHISYFNKKSFDTMIIDLGLKTELCLADFPIDIFLLNDHSNYINDPEKGKQAHLTRILTMNMLINKNIESTVRAMLEFGNLEFGRNLTVFIKK